VQNKHEAFCRNYQLLAGGGKKWSMLNDNILCAGKLFRNLNLWHKLVEFSGFKPNPGRSQSVQQTYQVVIDGLTTNRTQSASATSTHRPLYSHVSMFSMSDSAIMRTWSA
jgi:hypothetical protein